MPWRLSPAGGFQCYPTLDLFRKQTVYCCLQGGFSYSGQRCTAVKVVLVHESVADELVEKVLKGVKGLSVGKPEVGALGLGWCSTFTVEIPRSCTV